MSESFRTLIVMLVCFFLLLIVIVYICKKDVDTLLKLIKIGFIKEFTTWTGPICLITFFAVLIVAVSFVGESHLRHWFLLLLRAKDTPPDFSKAEAYWGAIVVLLSNFVLLGVMRYFDTKS